MLELKVCITAMWQDKKTFQKTEPCSLKEMQHPSNSASCPLFHSHSLLSLDPFWFHLCKTHIPLKDLSQHYQVQGIPIASSFSK